MLQGSNLKQVWHAVAWSSAHINIVPHIQVVQFHLDVLLNSSCLHGLSGRCLQRSLPSHSGVHGCKPAKWICSQNWREFFLGAQLFGDVFSDSWLPHTCTIWKPKLCPSRGTSLCGILELTPAKLHEVFTMLFSSCVVLPTKQTWNHRKDSQNGRKTIRNYTHFLSHAEFLRSL